MTATPDITKLSIPGNESKTVAAAPKRAAPKTPAKTPAKKAAPKKARNAAPKKSESTGTINGIRFVQRSKKPEVSGQTYKSQMIRVDAAFAEALRQTAIKEQVSLTSLTRSIMESGLLDG